MAKIVISIDGVVVKEAELVKPRTTLGRRPYNDIVIDNRAVSGEHAALHMHDHEVEVEDLGSTNGTHVNGVAVSRQALRDGDTLEMGRYTMRFFSERPADFEETVFFDEHNMPSHASVGPPSLAPNAAPAPQHASLADRLAMLPAAALSHGVSATALFRIVSGPSMGREVPLTKIVTTLGKPGVAVASVMNRRQGFVLAHVEGLERPKLNGTRLGEDAVPLASGDVVWLGGIEMQFVQS